MSVMDGRARLAVTDFRRCRGRTWEVMLSMVMVMETMSVVHVDLLAGAGSFCGCRGLSLNRVSKFAKGTET